MILLSEMTSLLLLGQKTENWELFIIYSTIRKSEFLNLKDIFG